MTEQPLVSCCWAIVAYLEVSFCAFWMSVSTPWALNALSRAWRSPFSQRLDDAASGRITHARLAAFVPVVPPPEEELSEPRLHPVSAVTTAAVMATATVALFATKVISTSLSRGTNDGVL